MMIGRLPRFLPLVAFSAALLIAGRGAHGAASPCPGDINNDFTVTIDELIKAVNAALNNCAPPQNCGDGVVQSGLGEECDGANLDGASCTSLQFSGGTLACSGYCRFDTSGCVAGGGLLRTGQTQCDQGTGTLGACPGEPPGQDGAVQAGQPLGYTDNGNGTITDTATGLVWEKLSDDDSIHDWENTYTWHDAFGAKIATLNTPPCFADHCDWRLPNRRELESLVDAGRYAPAIDPAFYTACAPGCTVATCSCTQLDNYWTSTTYVNLPQAAWVVDANTGRLDAYEKGVEILFYTRAVRGGP